MPVILDVLAAFGIAVVGADGYEADDVIGTLATRTPGCPSTSSPATATCSSSSTTTPRCGSSTSPAASAGTSGSPTPSCGRSTASTAAQYADFAALRGDASDGLPGVAGIGEKTAATLLQRFGDMAGLRAAAADPDSNIAPEPAPQDHRGAADYLEVAAARRRGRARHRPRRRPTSPCRSPRVDPDALVALSEQWGLESPIARLVETLTDLR